MPFGNYTWPDDEPVPLIRERCTSQYEPDSKAHICRRMDNHKGEHKCICGKKWDFLDSRSST